MKSTPLVISLVVFLLLGQISAASALTHAHGTGHGAMQDAAMMQGSMMQGSMQDDASHHSEHASSPSPDHQAPGSAADCCPLDCECSIQHCSTSLAITDSELSHYAWRSARVRLDHGDWHFQAPDTPFRPPILA